MKIFKQLGNFFKSDNTEKSKIMSEGKTTLDDILNFNYSMLYGTFDNYYNIADKNISMIFSDHWTEQQKLEFSQQGRLPVNIPVLFPKALTLIGMEKQNRKQHEVSPQGKEDELIAEIINKLFRFIENNPDPKLYQYSKTDVYTEGILGIFGVLEIYVETDEFRRPVIKYRQVPYYEFLFDTASYDYELTNCRRMQRHYLKYISELIKDYPTKENEILKIEEDFMDMKRFPFRNSINAYFDSDSSHPDRKLVRVIEDYQKINKKVVRLHSLADDKTFEFDTLSEAKKQREEMVNALGLDYETLTDDDLETLFIIEDNIIIDEYVKTVIAGTVVLEETTALEVDEFPFTVYFSLNIGGKFMTPIQVMMSIQEYVDRLFSQLDYSIGISAKGGGEVDVNLIAENYNDVSQIKEAYTSGELMFKDGQGRLIIPTERGSADPKFFTVFEIFFKLLEDGFGGRTFQGASEGQNQSGKAIGKLLQVAQLMTNNYLDNLDRFDMQVGRKTYKYIKKYYTHDLSMKVLGRDFESKMLEVLKQEGLYQESLLKEGEGWLIYNPMHDKLKNITDSNMTVVVNKSSARIDESEMTREALFVLKNLGYNVPIGQILETLPLKPSDKQAIIFYDEQVRKQQEQFALQQARFEGYDKMAKNINQSAMAMGNIYGAKNNE